MKLWFLKLFLKKLRVFLHELFDDLQMFVVVCNRAGMNLSHIVSWNEIADLQ